MGKDVFFFVFFFFNINEMYGISIICPYLKTKVFFFRTETARKTSTKILFGFIFTGRRINHFPVTFNRLKVFTWRHFIFVPTFIVF